MQILAFEKALYNIVAGIFTFVAKVYDVMLTLARSGTDAGSISDYPIADVATVMYTIAGVFMLFRVTIAMINMLINPDAVSDSKAGAGKLVTRIITVIVLLLLFVPNGFMFGETGILNRLEQALLAEDGLINNILPNSISGAGGNVPDDMDTEDTTTEANTNTTAMNGVIDNVHAAEVPNTVDCYYFYKEATKTHKEQGQDINDTGHSHIRVNGEKGILHIKFWNYPSDPNSDGNRKALCIKTGVLASLDCDQFTYTIVTDNNTSYKNDLIDTSSTFYGSHYMNGWANTLTENKSGDKVPTCPHIITSKPDAQTGKANSWKTEKSGIVGGWHSEASMKADLQAVEALVVGDDDTSKAVESTLGLQNEKDWKTNALNNDARDGVDPLAGLDNYDEAVKFAQMAMGTFLSCTGSTNCEAYAGQILISPAADKGVVQDLAADPPTMHLDFLPALIAGVGILIWVLVMCVDVIVRRFKLLLLQMIAPIPIISYVDPNDKMFDKWKDMFIATYLDLFIKLIAISFAIYLLQIVGEVGEDLNLILKFFYIVAILVFAKAVPSIISEIFGLKNMGGSFKDITGMAKAAAGFGAGALIGGATGLATGQGISRLTGAFKGAAMGAGAGSKGNVFGGAKAVAASNYNLQDAKANGLSFKDRLIGSAQTSVGIDPKKRIENKIKGKEFLKSNVNDVQNAVSDVEKSLEGTNVMKNLKNAFDRGEIDMDAYKSGMQQLANIWESGGKTVKVARRDNNGNILKDANGNILTDTVYDTTIKIRDKNGKMYGADYGLTVKEEAGFQKGYDSAISRFNKTVSTIQANSEIANTLHNDYGLSLTSNKAGMFDKVQDIKGTTFGADSALQEEIIGLKNGPEMQKAQAIDSYNAGKK